MSADLPPRAVVRRIVELATRAPSVHNTQPWTWRADGSRLLLHADRSRQLPVEDPDGRNLTISCGAALQHARVAAAAMGWDTTVALVPEGPSSTLLAAVSFIWSPEDRHPEQVIGLIEARRTDRRRFTSWPVAVEQLQNLADAAREWDARALPITEVTERFRLERLVLRAADRQRHDPLLQREQELWVDHGTADGVPSAVLPRSLAAARQHPSRFPVGLLDDGTTELEASDGVLVMYDVEDDAPAWLRVGQGLAALWLRATELGLSVVPMSQVIEVTGTRAALRSEVLGGLAVPHLLVRVGWQAIGRSDLPPSPRRPLAEVLDPRRDAR